MRLELSREAERDLADAFEWYESHRLSLGVEFIKSLAGAFARIELSPESFSRPEYYSGKRDIRRALLRRFPYQIVFEVTRGGRLLGLAIAHTSRRPGFWQDRLS